ncbi:MAG: hypothetical protein HBSAPP03_23470 [Phycisphaerae bacterium]|nr:MAG: hypothetical protein HBSAPP03_23470 [Phycisphaerae bacterium]
MTKADVFRLLLVGADCAGHLFDHSEISMWPPGALDECRRINLVRPAPTGLTAPCPLCDDHHIEAVTVVDERDSDENTLSRFFIWCPESLRVEVTAAMCQGWEVNAEGLAGVLAGALGLPSARPVVPGRLWHLGRMPWRKSTREVVLAMRLADDDGGAVTRHIGTGGRAVVFVPHRVPSPSSWPGRVPAVISLHAAASFTDEVVNLDAEAVLEAIAEADRLAEAAGGVSLDARGKGLVRNQVKSELKSHLGDDALVAAYKQHGSYDKAAKALSEQMGTKISRDKVWRAVNRAGGIDAVLREDDSGSVGRVVASQPRDRAKKNQQYRK